MAPVEMHLFFWSAASREFNEISGMFSSALSARCCSMNFVGHAPPTDVE